MIIEHRCTNELSILIQEATNPTPLVKYSLHNRLKPFSYSSSLLTESELLASIVSQITTLAAVTNDRKKVVTVLEETIKTFLGADTLVTPVKTIYDK